MKYKKGECEIKSLRKTVYFILETIIVILILTAEGYTEVVRTDDVALWSKKNGKGKAAFCFVVYGDCRPTAPTRPIPGVVDKVFEGIALLHPDFVINTGDIIVGRTDNSEQAREEFLRYIKKVYDKVSDVPMIFVPGNHEASSLEVFLTYRKLFGSKLYENFHFENSHFILTTTNYPTEMLSEGEHYGIYNVNDGEHDLGMADWVVETLNKEAKYTFMVGHVPFFSAITPHKYGEDAKCFTSQKNRDRFLKLILDESVEAYFCGHEHLFYGHKEKDTHFFTLGGGGAPLYGPTTGGYLFNTIPEMPGDKPTMDPIFDHGGRVKGYNYDTTFTQGVLSLFSYMLVTVTPKDVFYELIVPHSFEKKFLHGNDGVAPESIALVENRTPYPKTFRGLTFTMPASSKGYEVTGTYVDWTRKVKSVVNPPVILETQKVSDYQTKVRIAVTVPGGDSVDVSVRVKNKD